MCTSEMNLKHTRNSTNQALLCKFIIMTQNSLLSPKYVSTVKSQKGIITIQSCSFEDQKGTIAVQSLWLLHPADSQWNIYEQR